MLELFMLFLEPDLPSLHNSEDASTDMFTASKLCDDGSRLFHPDGSPNWDCDLDGCSLLEGVCWAERLDFCFDDAGNETGACIWRERKKCNSRWTCFKLWASCDGRFDYDFNTGHGSCTPVPAVRPPKSTKSRAVFAREDFSGVGAQRCDARQTPPFQSSGRLVAWETKGGGHV